MGQAPMTVALVIEFSSEIPVVRRRGLVSDTKTAYAFLNTMKRDDCIAVIRYDLRSQIVQDFTNDPMKLSRRCTASLFPTFPRPIFLMF